MVDSIIWHVLRDLLIGFVAMEIVWWGLTRQ